MLHRLGGSTVHRAGIPAAQMAGLAIGILCVLANAFGSVMARGINRQYCIPDPNAAVVETRLH